MDIRKAISGWARKHDESSMEQSSRLSHRDAYHGFFEGYTEIRLPDAGGKRRIRRIYTGAHYRPRLSRGKRILLRLLYSVLYLLAVLLFFAAARTETPSNHAWYGALPQAGALPMLVWWLIAFLYYLPAKDMLEIGEYNRSAVPLRRASLAASVCLLLAAAAALLPALAAFPGGDGGAWPAALLFALSAAAMFVIFRLESRIIYEYVDSTADIPAGGVEID